jgi:hypothetical protein
MKKLCRSVRAAAFSHQPCVEARLHRMLRFDRRGYCRFLWGIVLYAGEQKDA